MPDPNLVSAVFEHRRDAEQAVARVQELGLTPADISVVHARDEGELPPTEEGPDYVRPAGGAAVGAVLGGLVGVAAGPIGLGIGAVTAAAGGAVAGGALGGLAGALTHLGHADEEAGFSEEQVQQGRTLVTVWARSRSP